MNVQFTRSWRNYRKGQVISPPPGQAREMIRRGIVVAVETAPAPAAAKPTASTVTMVPPVRVEVATFADDGPKSGKKRKG